MRTHLHAMRVTKQTWYHNGGFRNSDCFRRHNGCGWLELAEQHALGNYDTYTGGYLDVQP